MDMGYYILGGADGHTPVYIGDDFARYLAWAEENYFCVIVKQEDVGEYFVSTVFFPHDMNIARLFNPDAPPHLFETMVFHGPDRSGVNQERCSTWAEADAQHERLASALRVAIAG